MKVAFQFATALSVIALISTGSIAASAQSNTPLDQINVDGANNNTNNDDKYKGTILEDPAVGVPGVVLTKEDLDIIQPQDLQDVFINETFVSVGGSTPVTQKIYVNGIEDALLAVTVDGARQSNATFHHAGTLLLDPALLKAARVDAGVAPADAGPGALGGSIQLETVDVKDLLDPGKTMGGFVTVSYDTNSETFSSGVSGYTMSNGFEVLGYYKFHNGSNWGAGNGQEQGGTAADLMTALGKFAYEAQTGDRFEFSYEWVNDDAIRPYRANFGAVIGTNGLPNFTDFPNQPYDLQRKTFTFNYSDEKPNGWWNPKIVIAYNDTSLDHFDLDNNGQTEGFADVETWSGKFENKFALTNGDVTAGVDFFDTDASGGYIPDFGRETDRNFGVYAQARLDLMKQFRVSFGGRVDHQQYTKEDENGVKLADLDDTGFSGNISSEFDLNEIFTLKGGYAHVFGRIPVSEAYLLPYSSIDPSTIDTYHSNNYTVGLSADYEGFTFDVSYSLLEIDDALNQVGRSKNTTSDIEAETFNVALGYKWATGFFKAQYSNIDVTRDDDAIGTTSFYVGTNIGELITLQIVHEIEGTGIKVGADAQIAFEQDDTVNDGFSDDPIPSYEVFNAFVEYNPKTFSQITLRAEVNNIFDEAYADRATSGQEYNGTGFRDIVPLLEPGRSFYLSAKAKF